MTDRATGGRPHRGPTGLGTAQSEAMVAVALGVVAGVTVGRAVSLPVGLLIGWDLAAVVYMTWIWATILRQGADETSHRATMIDPDRTVTDILLLTAAVASLVAVGSLLSRASQLQGAAEVLRVGLALASVALSWAMVHTIYTLRYAHLYYDGTDGGIDFNASGRPTYADFAYLAFTIGMTFQVSDTALTSQPIRRTALRHGLLSYVFGTGILAISINLVASLSSR
jgi:uncharacterized membrane protein